MFGRSHNTDSKYISFYSPMPIFHIIIYFVKSNCFYLFDVIRSCHFSCYILNIIFSQSMLTVTLFHLAVEMTEMFDNTRS